MIQLKKSQLHLMEPFAPAFHDTTGYTVMQGIGGSAWVDNIAKPKSAITLYGDFCLLAGEPVGDEIEEEIMEMLDLEEQFSRTRKMRQTSSNRQMSQDLHQATGTSSIPQEKLPKAENEAP